MRERAAMRSQNGLLIYSDQHCDKEKAHSGTSKMHRSIGLRPYTIADGEKLRTKG